MSDSQPHQSWWTNGTKDEFIRRIRELSTTNWYRYNMKTQDLSILKIREPEDISEFNQVFDMEEYFKQYDTDGGAYLISDALKGYAYWSKGRTVQEDLEELLK